MQKVILLFSGGLDSLLCYHLLKEDFKVKVIQFYMPFLHIKDKNEYIEKIKKNYGINLNLIDISEKYIKIFFNPKFGYGDNLNPCVDCKILFLKEAKKIMIEEGYDCIATGEIPGQRPFSQQKSFMNLIEKEADIRGYILRPLAISTSKINFELDKSKFLDLKGRSRKPQLELAKKYNIQPIPSPAGGCLLTDIGYCKKIETLKIIFNEKDLKPVHFEVIKYGRVILVKNEFIFIVGRNKFENKILEKFSKIIPSKFISISEIPSPSILILPNKNIEPVKNELILTLKKYTKKKFHEKILNERGVLQ